MGINKEKIELVINNIIKNENGIKKLAKTYNTTERIVKKAFAEMKRAEKDLDRQSKIRERNEEIVRKNLDKSRLLEEQNMKKMEIANQGFTKTMRMSQQEWANFNKRGGKFNTMGGRLANTLKKATHGLRGFKMEMLGVMFFGMSMLRTFNGLIRKSLEWMGVMDIFSTALGLLFLPVAELLLDWALKFLDWVEELTPSQKKLIGMFVLLGSAIGGFLFIFGTLALGIGSIILAFSWLLSPLGLVIAAFTTLAGYWIFKKMFKESSEGLDKLRENTIKFGLSGEVFDNMVDKIKEWYKKSKDYLFGNEGIGKIEKIGLIQRFKDALVKISNSEEVKTAGKNAMKKLVEGAKEFFTSNPMVLIGAVVGGLSAGPLGASIGAAIGLGFERIDFDKISEITSSGIDILNNVIGGITDNLDKLSEVSTDIAEKISNFIIENIDDFIEIGFTIAGAIAKGIGKSLRKKIDNLLHIKKGSFWETFMWGPDMSNSNEERVEDAIIKPNGDIIRTHPNDTLIATQNPGGIGGGNPVFNINIEANISNDYDVRRLADNLKKYWVSDFERASMGGTV